MKPVPPVLCFGEALWDLLPGGRAPGGAPLNVALRLASSGIDVRLLSRVGDDPLGQELLAHLAGAGLDTESVQIDRSYPTGCVNADTRDPAAVSYDIAGPAAWDFIDSAEYRRRFSHHCEAVVFGSLAARSEVSRRSLLDLLARSDLRIFDVNLRPPFDHRDIVEPLLMRSDWIKLNESELDTIAAWCRASGSVAETMRAIGRHYGVATVCVTLGDRGAIMLHRAEVFAQAAFEVDVVDTIGCGDAFLGCWLAQMLKGKDPGAALLRACAAGALVAMSAGANPRVDEQRLQAIISSRPLIKD